MFTDLHVMRLPWHEDHLSANVPWQDLRLIAALTVGRAEVPLEIFVIEDRNLAPATDICVSSVRIVPFTRTSFSTGISTCRFSPGVTQMSFGRRGAKGDLFGSLATEMDTGPVAIAGIPKRPCLSVSTTASPLVSGTTAGLQYLFLSVRKRRLTPRTICGSSATRRPSMLPVWRNVIFLFGDASSGPSSRCCCVPKPGARMSSVPKSSRGSEVNCTRPDWSVVRRSNSRRAVGNGHHTPRVTNCRGSATALTTECPCSSRISYSVSVAGE